MRRASRHSTARRDDPDEQREEERLCHGRGGEVEQVGVEAEERRCDDGPGGRKDATAQAIEAHDTGDVADQGRPRAGHAVLPPLHIADERKHEQVRQRQPDSAQLHEAGVAGVENAAGDAEVSDGIAVEEHVAVGSADGQRHESGHDGEHADGKGLRAGCGGDYVRVDIRSGRTRRPPSCQRRRFILPRAQGARSPETICNGLRSHPRRRPAGAPCRSARRQTIP